MTRPAVPARLLAAAALLLAIVAAAVTALLTGPAAAAAHRAAAVPAFSAGTIRLVAHHSAVDAVPAHAVTAQAVATRAAEHNRRAGIAYVRVAHFSAGTPAVDVYLTGFAGGRTTLWLSDLGYGHVSGYRRIPAGTYVVSMRPHVAPAARSPVASWTVTLAAGRSYTVAAIGSGAHRHGVVFRDAAPRAAGNRGWVRVIDAAGHVAAPTVRLTRGPVLGTALRFGQVSQYRAVAPGRRSVAVTSATVDAGLAVRVAPGSAISVLLLDRPGGGGFIVRTVTDTAAPGHVPVGPVDAGGGGTSGAAADAASSTAAALGTGGRPQHDRRPSGSSTRPDRPIALSIPSLGVRTALQPLGLLADGTLQPPSRWQTAGWYAAGIVPGHPGPAVITGHVDSVGGPAVFYRLDRLRAGERAVIRTAAGRRLVFLVDALHRYRKAAFPTRAVYGPTPDPELRLITCTGRFDAATGSYVDNLVVSAHLAPGTP